MGATDVILDAIDELAYRSYRKNRIAAPEITPRSWQKVYGPDAERYELRYSGEISAQANGAIKREQESPQHDFGASPCGRSTEPGR